MIRSYRNRGLERFATSGDASKLAVRNTARVNRILTALNAATKPEDLNLPGYAFHGLQGKPKRYAVSATGNYRITFGWDEGDAVDVDLEDYH